MLLLSLGVFAARWSAKSSETVQALELPASPAPTSNAESRPAPDVRLPQTASVSPLEVAAAVLPAAPSQTEKTAGTADRLGASCAWQSDNVPVYQSAQARKPGDMVYIVSQVSQVLCVADASGKSQVRRLEAGQAQSFYGQPPWQVASSQLQQTQLYFQGWKVRLPERANDRIQLVELPEQP